MSDKKILDMIVNLYDLPDSQAAYTDLHKRGIEIRRVRSYEKHTVQEWVLEHFSALWGSEFEIACARQPISCFIATKNEDILGFICNDTTAKGFIGPMGVAENTRGQNIGKALLLLGLEDLKSSGYVYAIIGGVGPRSFYEKSAGACVIPNCVNKLGETGLYTFNN